MLRAALTGALANPPDGAGPLERLFDAFRSVVPLLEGNRPSAEPWHAVISATPALAEREQAKLAALADALTASLEARGDPLRAALAARIGMAAFAPATIAWLDDPGLDLPEHLERAFHAVATLLGEQA